jgi:SOS response regulatory protein OraA/RecX
MHRMKVASRRFLPAKGCYELRLEDRSRLWASPELEEQLPDTLGRDELARLRAESEYLHARDYALRAIGRREHFVSEIRQRLYRRQVTGGAIRRLVDELVDEGLLDDNRAARAFTEERLSRGLIGPFRIVSDLVKRGLSKEHARRIVAEVSPPEYEDEVLDRFVARRAESYRRKLADEVERTLGDTERTNKLGGKPGVIRYLRAKYLGKIRSKLVSAGFTGELASRTARRIVFEE